MVHLRLYLLACRVVIIILHQLKQKGINKQFKTGGLMGNTINMENYTATLQTPRCSSAPAIPIRMARRKNKCIGRHHRTNECSRYEKIL